MTDAALASVAQWLGVAFAAGAVLCGTAALLSRSAFAMIMRLAAAAALGACTLLAMANGEGAIALALFGVGVAPVLLMGGALLSAQVSKRAKRPWTSVLLALAAIAPIAWAAADLANAPAVQGAPVAISGVWLAALALVAACACAGLLGYGERGIMQRREGGGE